ncbi:glucosamine-6-phosphate deaminase [Rubrolithibacter danxiaensis]|uniref:glucosamine-6-phosphate deaminase n=1 Tax=Rubrolithibacter danxiaensis TaxID=3390805 RepID=UPI003BF79A28
MKILTFANYEKMSVAAADFVVSYIQQKSDALLCFPSGDSPTGILSVLIRYAEEGKVNFDKCSFVGLDEWVGMDETNEGSCKHYMYSKFFNPLKIRPDQIIFFNALALDLDKECKRIDDLISLKGGIDIMMVGVGMNGHIGLNEPGTDFNSYSHHSELDQTTKTVGQKYFKQETELKEGITLGIKHLLEAKHAVLIAHGSKKASIISKALDGEITNQVPASIFQKIENSVVYLDKDAASQLKLDKFNEG